MMRQDLPTSGTLIVDHASGHAVVELTGGGLRAVSRGDERRRLGINADCITEMLLLLLLPLHVNVCFPLPV